MTFPQTDMSPKREAVLQAALVLIDENGFDGTSMAMIAEEAGVGAGTIYRYFDGKEDLINQLYSEARADAHRDLVRNFDRSDPVHDRLYTLWRSLIRKYLDCPVLYQFILQYESSPYLRDSVRSEIEEMEAPFREIRVDGIEAGLFDDLPDSIFKAFLIGASNYLVQKHLDGRIDLTDEMIDQAFDMLWAGFTAGERTA